MRSVVSKYDNVTVTQAACKVGDEAVERMLKSADMWETTKKIMDEEDDAISTTVLGPESKEDDNDDCKEDEYDLDRLLLKETRNLQERKRHRLSASTLLVTDDRGFIHNIVPVPGTWHNS